MKAPFACPPGPTRSRRLGERVLVRSVPPPILVMTPLLRLLGSMSNSGGVAGGAARTACGGPEVGRIEEELLSGVFLRGEIRERRALLHLRAARVELRVERLDAADELREGALDAGFVDGGVAEGHGEEDAVFVDGGELGDQRGEIRIAGSAAEAHLHMILDRLGGLVLEVVGAFVPEEPPLVGEARIDQPHRVAPGGAVHAGARRGGIGEGVRLMVAGGTGDGVVAREALVIEEHAAERGAGIGDGVAGGGVVFGDVGRHGLAGVVREFGQIEHAVTGDHEICHTGGGKRHQGKRCGFHGGMSAEGVFARVLM